MQAKKTFFIISLATLLNLCSIVSYAASSQATMKIQGEILPSACDLFIDNGGELRLGKNNISTASASQDGIILPERTIGINIQCPSLTSFGIRTTDLAANAGNVKHRSAGSTMIFSLGQTESGEPIGGYFATIDKSQSWIDGNLINSIIVSQDQGHSWQPMQGMLHSNGESVYSWGNYLRPLSAHVVKLGLKISPFLYKASYNDAIKLDGLTSFELIYL